jgi:uncharacterized membrane protein
MSKNRLEAFTDGVLAILVTLLVLEIPRPQGFGLDSLWADREPLAVYLITFIFIVIYWNNHHHLFQLVERVDGKVLWANNAILFFLSLFPFASAWVGRSIHSFAPQLLYALLILLANTSWAILMKYLSMVNHHNSRFKRLIANYHKMKVTLSVNILAVAVTFFFPLIALIINLFMTFYWFIPDKRMEKIKSKDVVKVEKK